MSAHRDQHQGFTFIYSNFYQLYRHTKAHTQAHAPIPCVQPQKTSPELESALIRGRILKTKAHSKISTKASFDMPIPAEVSVVTQAQTVGLKKWMTGGTPAQKSVRDDLKALRLASKRIQYLTQELEALNKKRKA